MRQLIIVIVLLGLCSFPATAGDHPKAEFYVGYQYTHYPATSQWLECRNNRKL